MKYTLFIPAYRFSLCQSNNSGQNKTQNSFTKITAVTGCSPLRFLFNWPKKIKIFNLANII